MAQHQPELLAAGALLCVCGLLGCAEGTLHREDVTRTRDNPFPPLELTSSDPVNDPSGEYLLLSSHPLASHPDWHPPLSSHPLASHPAAPDAGVAAADAGDAGAEDAGDAAAPDAAAH